jgi:hypothetical protein
MKDNNQDEESTNPPNENRNGNGNHQCSSSSTSNEQDDEHSLDNGTTNKTTIPAPAGEQRTKEQKNEPSLTTSTTKTTMNGSTPPAVDGEKSSSSSMDFVEKVRNRAKKCLSNTPLKIHDDFDFTLNCVKGLIKVNREIWVHCEQFCQSKPALQNDVVMYRLSFDKVRVTKYNHDVIFTTSPEFCVESFGYIPKLPKELEEIFPLSCCCRNGCIFPDYGRYLRNLLLLEDSILGVSLSRYQSYLESVQVFLGIIDDWITQSMETRDFVGNLFDKDLTDASVSWNKDYSAWFSQTITLFTLPDRTTMDITFDVSTKRDRKRLKTYLEFLLM